MDQRMNSDGLAEKLVNGAIALFPLLLSAGMIWIAVDEIKSCRDLRERSSLSQTYVSNRGYNYSTKYTNARTGN